MNVTLKVRTLFNCDEVEDYKQSSSDDPLWAQTVFGCRLLMVLQDMYGFNLTYIAPDIQSLTEDEKALAVFPQVNDTADVYAKPLAFTRQLLEISCPIEAIFTQRYGFMLKRPRSYVLRKFYSLPFTKPVWNCLYLTILVVSGIFFYLSRWEKTMLGGYSSYHYELLLAIGACCLHILPLQAHMSSRRIAYFSFIVSAYVLNAFYCSNLLSHLVSDKDSSMDLESLANSDYECAKLGLYNVSTQHMIYQVQLDSNMSVVQNKLSQAKYMNLMDGLNAVMTSKTALLSDYSVLYPALATTFETDDVCQLIEIDLYSNIKKYFVTSKSFSYKDEFKIGVLRAKETGVLKRILLDDILPPLNCAHTYPMRAEFEQVVIPLAILLGSYVVATVIMLFERWHHRTYKVWPYVD